MKQEALRSEKSALDSEREEIARKRARLDEENQTLRKIFLLVDLFSDNWSCIVNAFCNAY